MTTLRSLAAFNEAALARYRRRDARQGNGIACPKCGTELRDTRTLYELQTTPPRLWVNCPNFKCKWRGTRVA